MPASMIKHAKLEGIRNDFLDFAREMASMMIEQAEHRALAAMAPPYQGTRFAAAPNS